MPRKRSPKGSSPSKSRWKKFLRIAKLIILWFFGVSIFWVLCLRFINPPLTWLMVQRGIERKWEGKPWKIEKQWTSGEELPRNLKLAAMAGEDSRFLDHWGFDRKAIESAYNRNQKSKKLRGGSTITQQVAKNVFLWPGRSWVRKGFEAYFTVLVELLWSKERIMEVYLNVVEVGDGLYGVEAASVNFFNKKPAALSKGECALIIAVLPNPNRWSPAHPTAYIYRKQSIILRNMRRLKNADI